MLKLFGYKKCSTCRNAEKLLKEQNVAFEFVDITVNPPSSDEFKKIFESSKLPSKKLFNTSGVVYREMGLKDKVAQLSQEEAIGLLTGNGKLVKRPILFNGKNATVGFNADEILKVWC